ncbi:hypothetical protein ACOMHN_052956 [Nucella lapillus]
MSPNKNKRGAAAVKETSLEEDPSTPTHCGSSLSGDEAEENALQRGGASLYGPSSLRSFGFNGQKKPAELFRKDLISAMKLADKDSLPEESYFLISDPWRQEWEKGVQVPVNVIDIKDAKVKEIREKIKAGDFKMPHKLLHERLDEVYRKGQHMLTGMPELAEQLVRYDLDDLDVCWLHEVNFKYREMGLPQISEWNMERVIEVLENECHKNMTEVMKTEGGMGIEFDEDIVCDVCRSTESEETNEMVFCDKCDICIHQACYGIKTIPQGSWLCRTCAVGVKPTCMLCPNMGGAMKSTRSGTRWVHVSCALWIPEVGFGDPDKVEPVIKISHIPPSRWSLTCCVCKDRVGACIQCSVAACKTAFHVTCAFSSGLHMNTVLEDKAGSDDVKLKAFCPKHSKRRERTQSESDLDTPRKKASRKDSPRKNSPRKDSPPTPRKLTQEERANLRSKKLKALGEEFYKAVKVSEVVKSLQLEEEVVSIISVYWKLKRKCNCDKSLLTPKVEEEDILEKQEEDSRVARMKMFVHLRHDLERARNLCYMISKREKMKRQLFHNKEHVFKTMARVLKNKSLDLSKANIRDIVQNYHFDSVYDDYGRSIPKLPGELSEEEKEASEAEEAVTSGAGGRKKTEKGVRKVGKRALPLLSPSANVESEDSPKPGRSRGTGHKTRRKNATAKKIKEVKNQALASAPECSVSVVKESGADSDGCIQVMSADESEDERVQRMPGSMAGKGKRPIKGTLWSDLLSPTPRRFRQKKPRRGRKPWYEKRSPSFELTPNLALSTDDDEDTKGPCEGGRESASVEKSHASEENVLVDVIGEGESDEKTVESQLPIPKSGNDGTRNRGRQASAVKEVNNNRRKRDRMLRTKLDAVQAKVDTRTKTHDVAPKCISNLKKSGSLEQVKSPKEGEDASGAVPLLPTRTSNRKRRNFPSPVSGSELTLAEDSVQEAATVRAGIASPHEEDRSSAVSPAKVRKSSRSRSRKGKEKAERTGPDMKEVEAEMRRKFAELHEQLKPSVPSKQQTATRNPPAHSTQPAEIHGEGKSQGRGELRLWEVNEDKVTDVSMTEEESVSVRKGKQRQSSHRAREMWNRLLISASNSAGSESKSGKPQDKSSQPQGRHSRASSSSRSVSSTRQGSVGRIKIKQEKEPEKPQENASFKKEQDFEGKSSTLRSSDVKVNDSKTLLASGNVSETVKNGFHKRQSRRGKCRLLNGMVDNKQRKIDSFFKISAKSVDLEEVEQSLSMKHALNEVTPGKRDSWQNADTAGSAPHSRGKYTSEEFSGRGQVLTSSCLHPGGEGSGEEDSARRKVSPSGESEELEAVSPFTKGQCQSDKFSMDTLRAFRSQSPSSDASTITGLLIDSRESTPRRFTRSQRADPTVEHSPSLRNGEGRNRRRTKSRNHRLKSSKAL